jgi:2-methylcitrate dehydratase PrpD
MQDLAERVGRWAAGFRADSRRAAAMRLLVRDFAACVVAGSQLPELAPALQLSRPGTVKVWGRDEGFDAPSAALVCGTAGALLQLHDLYLPALLHPSCTVIAAAVAACPARTVDAGRFIDAVGAGYEVCNRIGAACSGQAATGSVATATAGAFGAAVAASLVRGADAAHVARAVSLVPLLMPVTPVAAVRGHAELVSLHGGLAARAAIEAAELAVESGRALRVLEGDARTTGFLTMLCGRAVVLEPERWDGTTIDAVVGKRIPACFGAYAPLEAVLLTALPPLAGIRTVRIGLGARLLPIVELGPVSGQLYDRLMSVRWVVARALERKRLGHRDLDAHAETLQLAARIEVHHEPALDALAPTLLAAEVEVEPAAAPATVQRVSWRRSLTEPGSANCGTLLLTQPGAWHEKYRELTAGASDPGVSLDALLGAS